MSSFTNHPIPLILLRRRSTVQLLHKLSIRSVNSPEKLLKVIKNPVTDHLPPNCRKFVLSADADVVNLREWVPEQFGTTEETNGQSSSNGNGNGQSACFFIGSFAHGADDFADGIAEEKIGISQFNLSAATSCAKLCEAFEGMWGIL